MTAAKGALNVALINLILHEVSPGGLWDCRAASSLRNRIRDIAARKLFIDHTGLVIGILILLVMDSGHDSQLGDPTLLAKMDKLREKGISEYIRLPQVRLQITL